MDNKSHNKEFSIWKHYTKTVVPLLESNKVPHKTDKNKTDEKKYVVTTHTIPTSPSPSPYITKPVQVKTQKTATFHAEKNIKKRMKKGKFTYDARIDLHGLTQNQAYDRLIEFITHNYKIQKRNLLIITGRGRFCYKTLSSMGILIKKVPEWLHQPPFSPMISVIEPASLYDGGEGALYVILSADLAIN